MGRSGHETVEFKMELVGRSMAKSRIATLEFLRAKFDVLRDLLGGVSWARWLEVKGACVSWEAFKQHFFQAQHLEVSSNPYNSVIP